MRRHLVLSLATCASLGAVTTAHAFFEEGNDDPSRLGYKKCSKWGEMTQASLNGCNPWPDNDSAYSFKTSKDMKKNSVHYNSTAALAVAAGFDRCAAYAIALYDEGTDVATAFDLDLWIPFPSGVSATGSCAALLANEGISVVNSSVDGKPGGLVSPDFSYRSFANTPGNEVLRESDTFHFNHAPVFGTAAHQCSTGADPSVAEPSSAGGSGPFVNMVTLPELKAWAMSSSDPNAWSNALSQCTYDQGDGTELLGPLTSYDPLGASGDPEPGSLGAMGMFLHSAQDYWSHKQCKATSHAFGLLANDACGLPSGHYAGEFGTINGVPANGKISITTPVNKYNILLHSADTVSALDETFVHLKTLLASRPELARAGGVQCSDAQVHQFAVAIAGIANTVPASGKASGAKRRSDTADSLFSSDNCSFTVK